MPTAPTRFVFSFPLLFAHRFLHLHSPLARAFVTRRPLATCRLLSPVAFAFALALPLRHGAVPSHSHHDSLGCFLLASLVPLLSGLSFLFFLSFSLSADRSHSTWAHGHTFSLASLSDISPRCVAPSTHLFRRPWSGLYGSLGTTSHFADVFTVWEEQVVCAGVRACAGGAVT